MILFACKLLIIITNCCQGYAAGKDIGIVDFFNFG